MDNSTDNHRDGMFLSHLVRPVGSLSSQMRNDYQNRRLTFFVPNLSGGGAERVMVNFANGLAALGNSVEIVLAGEGGVNITNVSSMVRVVELRAAGCFAGILPLARHLRKTKPDVVISTLSHANVVAILARLLAVGKFKLIIRETNQMRLPEYGVTLKQWVSHFSVKALYRYADVVLANADGLAQEIVDYVKIPAGRVKVVENPVVTDNFDQLVGEPLRDAWFADPRIPVVLGVGRLSPQKDFTNLIYAFSIVHRMRPARLVILGEGAERDKLTGLINELGLNECVRLQGYVVNPYPYMRLCGCFALSSIHEGCPNALIQALLLGAKVVSTDCMWGPSEILEGGKLGKLVPTGNPQQLAEAIVCSLNSPHGKRHLDQIQLLKKKYEQDSVLSKLVSIIEAL